MEIATMLVLFLLVWMAVFVSGRMVLQARMQPVLVSTSVPAKPPSNRRRAARAVTSGS